MNSPSNITPLCVALLAGGDSDEREISLQSGAAVQQALTSRGHTVIHLDPAVVDLPSLDWRQFEVAFIALHGRFGEDGGVQQILEAAGVPYTGSDAATSRLAFSKSAAKERFAQAGVPTPAYALVHYADDPERIARLVSTIGYPLVVKPDTQGSSLGISIVREPSELDAALRLCFQFDSFGLIEQFIAGTEWTVGLMDDVVLPAICIETPREFFDYHAKYVDESTQYRFDTGWPRSEVAGIEHAGAEACRALGTKGLARVDLRVDAAHRPWVLEINTVPGLTSHSLIPKAAQRVGIDFSELCERSMWACWQGRPPRPHHLQNSLARRRTA
ncbi:MAG: D-alanine--D-alanine ligase [Planctomycetaceae bacterium]|nr:D-alanine--D-alanine ligase [Planctomycetaceae bacterium]